ncbi:hypothetical protein O181_064945 [Austropuccinia psidii MF-1]|uniref:Uncharacterized protein n=1 Tax=Austropuccinia psidii MF-1 TaxID=1389203 RepID=A0A9Q3EU51_9BASI|nr:hypothetical protein [Austropuccinia psidii MF-1]
MNPRTTHVPSHMVIYNDNSQNNGASFEGSWPPIDTHPLHRFIQGQFDFESGPNSTFAGEERIAHCHHINQQYAGECISSPPNVENQYSTMEAGVQFPGPNVYVSPGHIRNWCGHFQIVSGHNTNIPENWSPASVSQIMQGLNNQPSTGGGNQGMGLTQSVERLLLTPSRSPSGMSWETTEVSGVISQLNSPIQSGANTNKRCKKSLIQKKRDSNPNFTLKDYINICDYIENEDNYNNLFGKTSKKNVGECLMTRKAAYKLFAGYLNSLNSALGLTGRHSDGSKPNFQALNELKTTSQGEIIVVSDSDDESDLEGVTDGDSGLSAYEKHQLQFKRAPKKKGTHSNDRSTIKVEQKFDQVSPKHSSKTQGAKGNLKQIHEQEYRESQDMHVRLLKDFVDLQAKK